MKFILKHIFTIISIIVILISLNEAWKLRWLCDDAFISFTYARNLFEGKGLVFQLGENVEGYSNFLWTIILSFSLFFTKNIMLTSQILGIISYVSLLIYFYIKERTLRPFANLPLFLLHLSFFYHAWVFATSGLETMMYTLFVTMGLVEWRNQSMGEGESKINDTNRNLLIGFLFLLASITRPDGALFLGFFFVSLWKMKKKLSTYLPIVGFIFFLIWRYNYYGDFLPNTYYAKADSRSYFSQGLMYFLYWMRVYPMYFPLLMISIFSLFRLFTNRLGNIALVLSVHNYIFYVIYVGGDFMAMRFWLPIIPYLSWQVYIEFSNKMDSLQIESNQITTVNRIITKNLVLLQFLFIISLAVYLDPFKNQENNNILINEIGEERNFYKNSLASGLGYDLEALNNFKVAFFGAQAHFIFFMRPMYAWEAETGLTDKELAHRKKLNFGRIGHSNSGNVEGLKSRDIELILDNRFPEQNFPEIQFTFRDFQWKIYVRKYNPEKFQKLCQRPGWNCQSFYAYLNENKFNSSYDHVFGKSEN